MRKMVMGSTWNLCVKELLPPSPVTHNIKKHDEKHHNFMKENCKGFNFHRRLHA